MKILLWICLIMTQSFTVHAATDKIYNAKSLNLPNGLQVIVIENRRTPAVTHMMWYKVGGGDEVMGKTGLAHYLEHLMFKGSKLVAPGDFSKKVKSWGGNDNAFTSWDYTAYYQTVPKEKLESVMLMESDRMQGLNFSDESALTERDVVIQERKERTDSNPSAQLGEAMRAALFVNHPYSRPIIGWDNELQKLTPQLAREFYKQYYSPQNAILVVSGDVNAKDVFEKANAIYGKMDNKGASKRVKWPEVPSVYGQTTVEHEHSSVKQPIWRKLYRAPSAGGNYSEFLALSVAENIFGGSTGLLYQSLVADKKLASSVSFYYSGVSVSDGTVSMGASPLDNVSFSQINQAVDAVLKDVADNGVSDDLVQKSIEQLQDEAVFERDSLTGPAMMVGYQLAAGLSLDQIEGMTTDLEQVTADDVKRVIGQYLVPSAPQYHAVIGHLLPEQGDE